MRRLQNYAREAQISLDKSLKRAIATRNKVPQHMQADAIKMAKSHRNMWHKRIDESVHFCAPDTPYDSLYEIVNPTIDDDMGYHVTTTPYEYFTLSFRYATEGFGLHKVFVCFRTEDDAVHITPFYEVKGEIIVPLITGKLKLKIDNWPSCYNTMGTTDVVTPWDHKIEKERDNLNPIIHTACMFLAYLEIPDNHSTDDPIIIPGHTPPPLSKLDRLRGNKREYSHKVLVIRKPKIIPVPLPGTGTSGYKQREHTRRGHTRILRSGRKVEVRPCVAGDARLGRIEKDYDLEPS